LLLVLTGCNKGRTGWRDGTTMVEKGRQWGAATDGQDVGQGMGAWLSSQSGGAPMRSALDSAPATAMLEHPQML
jgi:hypothetical protein